MWRVLGEIVAGLLLAGLLAPLTLWVLPDSGQGPAALWTVAVGSIAVVMGVSWLVRRRKHQVDGV